jgi:hypothetical protein
MPTPGTHDFEVYAGDTAIKKWQYFVDDSLTPRALTGATVHMQARRQPADATAVLNMTAVVDDAAQGAFHFEFDPAATTAATDANPVALLYYDVELRDGATVKTLVRGTLTVRKDVTRGN